MRFEILSGVLTDIILDKEEEEQNPNGVDVVIPDGVVAIGRNLCPAKKTINIKSVVFPEGLKEIREKAFWGQKNLANITFPTTISLIAESAFSCIGEADICIPEGINEIEICRNAFSYSLIKSFIVKEAKNVTIRSSAFQYSPQLNKVEINSNSLNLGEEAFICCSSLTVVNLKNTNIINKTIPYRCFSRCTSLSQIIFPERENGRIKIIEESAFRETAIKNLCFDYPIQVEPLAFGDCKELISIQITRKGHVPSILLDSAFRNCPNLSSANLSGVVYIGESCFSKDFNLKEVILSNRPEDDVLIKTEAFFETGINSIDCSSVIELGEKAFANCRCLSSVIFSDVAKFESIPPNLFRGNVSLKKISLPQNIKQISLEAFKGSGLEEIKLPASLKTISPFTFYSCKNLTTIDFSFTYDLETIGLGAFELTNIKLLNFSSCICLSKENCSIPQNTKVIYSYYSE